MTKCAMFVTAAAVFTVSNFATAANAQVVCAGANACKGQGFVTTGSSFECTVLKSK
jgi:hypothetical protein